MEKRIEKMRNHYIVCGIGMVGLYIVHELYETKRPQMVIDTDRGKFDLLKMRKIDVPVLLGDATENELLEKAGIREAKGLFATTNSDNDNIVIALTAKQLNPQLAGDMPVQRHEEHGQDQARRRRQRGGPQLYRRPAHGRRNDTAPCYGLHRVHAARQGAPAAGGRGDRAGKLPLCGKAYRGSGLSNMGNLLLLAIRKGEGEWIYNPSATLTLEREMRLIILATPEERQILHGALRFEDM